MGHGFAAVRALRLHEYAERFARAGYAAFVFDYRGWGDSAGEPRRVLSIPAQHEDWRAAIASARALEGIDPSRLVTWGSSFAGGHVLYLAARDHSAAAVIAQVPHISGPAAARPNPPALIARLALAAVRDEYRAARGREPYRVQAAGKPGSLAMMTSPDALVMAERLAGDRRDELMRENNVAARIALRVPFYSPGRTVDRITVPTLIQIAARDAVTPYDVAFTAAQRIPTAVIRSYDCQHFEPYLDPYFEDVVTDQIAFLDRYVSPERRDGPGPSG
jgi:fermentation-respiration switch protein FrsA (DUF1100 family)